MLEEIGLSSHASWVPRNEQTSMLSVHLNLLLNVDHFSHRMTNCKVFFSLIVSMRVGGYNLKLC